MLCPLVLILSTLCVCWGKSIPETTSGAPFNPRDLWDRLNTAEPDGHSPTEYPRIKPLSEGFGTSPSSLYLMEAYRLMGLNQLTASSISAFSASTFEDINQLRLTRPSFHHIYRLILSQGVLREHYKGRTEMKLWIPLFNQELARQVNKTEDNTLKVCISQKEKRRKQYCHLLDTTQLDLRNESDQSWVGVDIRDLVRKELESGNNRKHLNLYFTLDGCAAINGRCIPASVLDQGYREALELSRPRVPFVIMLDP